MLTTFCNSMVLDVLCFFNGFQCGLNVFLYLYSPLMMNMFITTVRAGGMAIVVAVSTIMRNRMI